MDLIFAFFSVIIGFVYMVYHIGKHGLGSGAASLGVVGAIIGGPIVIACFFGASDNIVMHMVGSVLGCTCIIGVMMFSTKRSKEAKDEAKRIQQIHEFVRKLDPTKDELDPYRRKLADQTGNTYLNVWDKSVIDEWYKDQFAAKYQQTFGKPYHPQV